MLMRVLLLMVLASCCPTSSVPQSCRDFCGVHVAKWNEATCSCDWNRCVNETLEGQCCDENWQQCMNTEER